MPVPGWSYLAVCFDTEGNIFGLWEENENAKYFFRYRINSC